MGMKGERELGGCSQGGTVGLAGTRCQHPGRGGEQESKLTRSRGCTMLVSLIEMGNADRENIWRNHQFYLGHVSSNTHLC